MQTVLISIHLIVVLGLIAVVLLQRSEGGLGLGGGGSGGVSGFMTGRGQANALTRATAILAALFFATSMALAIMSHRGAAPRSILEGTGDRASRRRSRMPATCSTPCAGQGGASRHPRSPDAGRGPGDAPAQPAVPQAPQSR